MDTLFSSLSFIASGGGILFVGALAAAIVLFWDWRVALICLFLVQLSLAALMTRVHGAPVQWGMVQTLVIGLCCIMLALSAMQVRLSQGGRQSGNWLFRGLILALLIAGWRILDVQVSLPLVNPQLTQLLSWLALIALLGLVEIVLGLTCSYLILAERLARSTTRPILTDVVFPTGDQGARSPMHRQANGNSGAGKTGAPVALAPKPLRSPPLVDRPDPRDQRGIP